MMRFAMYGALAGVLPPIVIIVITYFQGGVFEWPSLAVILWPTWIMLMGTTGQELTPWGIVVLVVSVLFNQILYSALGVLLGLFFSRVLK